MSARMPTAEQINSLRDTFRKAPPSTPRAFKAAGVLAGVSEAAARRAYERGWPGVEPIEAQLARERALQASSAEVLKAERIVTAMKGNAVFLQSEMRRLWPAVKALSDSLLTNIEQLESLPPERAVKALQRVTKVTRDCSAITAKAVELDRLLAGEATSIVGHKTIEPEAVDLDHAQALSERLARAVRRAQPVTAAPDEIVTTSGDEHVASSVN